ncbi:MAG: M23 family metallopeptidase [Clostridia bacterium]|nr:M23 family metallopeptidase [Clostridia bacterium]MBR5746504.1 M23 family metallopeptidase [Clostridia bacterium]
MASGSGAKKSKSLLAVLLCIPLAFIVYYLISYSSQAVSIGNVKQVTVQVPGGSETVFDKREDVDFFVDLLNGAKTISSPMRDVSDETPVNIICTRSDKSITYRLYPTLNLTGCLLIGPAPDNKLYVLESEAAGKLLLRDEFDYMYSKNFLPRLYVARGESKEEVLPLESNWKYKKADGNEYVFTPQEYAKGDETYRIYKGNENRLVFEPGTDVRNYELTDISYIAENGSQYSIRDISELDLSVDTLVTVSFTAKWSSLNGADCYGEAKYRFNVLYDIPAEISIDEEKIYRPGDFIVINAVHLNEGEEFALQTELDTTPIRFSMTGDDKGVALLPIALDNEPGTYSLKIMTGSGEQDFEITLEERANAGNWKPVQITAEDYRVYLTPDILRECADVLAAATQIRPATDYFIWGSEAMRAPVISGEIMFDYGDVVNLANAEITGDAGNLTLYGRLYTVAEGTQVRSAQVGEVVFAGTTAPTGNTVIIYHGNGIYTYYYHLASVNVQAGYTLTSGEIIGVAGDSGYTGGQTLLHFAVSIDGVFIDPAAALAK